MAASTSAVQVRVLEETAMGVVASGSPKRYRVTGESLNQTITSVASKELRADRQVSDSVVTSGEAAGGLKFELSHKTHNTFFEALLAGVFNPVGVNGVVTIADATYLATDNSINSAGGHIPTNLAVGQWFSIVGSHTPANDGFYRVSNTVAPTTGKLVADSVQKVITTDATASSVTLSSSRLKNGTAPLRTFTLEKQLSDINQFFSFVGMGVDSMSLTFATGSLLSGEFKFKGLQVTRNTASIFPGIGTEIAATTTPIFSSVVGTSVLLNNAAIGKSCANNLSLSVSAGIRELRCISSGIGAADLNTGTFKITATTELYFSGNTASVYDQMVAGTPVSLAICVTDSAGNGLGFTLNRCKISSSEVVAGAIDQDIVMKISLEATIDTVSGSMLIIDCIGSTL